MQSLMQEEMDQINWKEQNTEISGGLKTIINVIPEHVEDDCNDSECVHMISALTMAVMMMVLLM